MELGHLAEILGKLLGVKLQARSNADEGGYFALPLPDHSIYLKTNVYIDDDEPAERDFPEYAYRLYLYDADKHPEYLAAIESRPDIFIKLRTELD